jgi:hypothetical protein
MSVTSCLTRVPANILRMFHSFTTPPSLPLLTAGHCITVLGRFLRPFSRKRGRGGWVAWPPYVFFIAFDSRGVAGGQVELTLSLPISFFRLLCMNVHYVCSSHIFNGKSKNQLCRIFFFFIELLFFHK